MSELLEALGKSIEWLKAMWKPFMGFSRNAVSRHRDFDFASTAFLPAIFLVVCTIAIGCWAFTRNSGFSSLSIWIIYQPVSFLYMLAVVLLVSLAIALILLFFGNRILIFLWSKFPWTRYEISEIPVVDRAGLLDAFYKVRRNIAESASERGSWWSRIAAWLHKASQPDSQKPENRVGHGEAGCLFLEICGLLEALKKRSDEAVVSANRLGIGESREDIPHAVDGDRVRISPEADTVGATIEMMLDGLRPEFQSQHEWLVDEVISIQWAIHGALSKINEGVERGLVLVSGQSTVEKLVSELEIVSQKLARELAKAFGVDGRISSEPSGAGLPITGKHANSLAFNLEGTTLGKRSHWRPLEYYNWKKGEALTDRQLRENEEKERENVERLREIVNGLRNPAQLGNTTDSASKLNEQVEEYLNSSVAVERAQEDLDQYEKNRLIRLERLERLRRARSKILAYVTSASFFVLAVLAAWIALLSVFHQETLVGEIVASLLSAALVVGAMGVSAAVFVRPVLNHAFYVCMTETRLRIDAGGGRQPPEDFDWVKRSSDRAPLRGIIFVGFLVFAFSFMGQRSIEEFRGFDYRLVAVSKRFLDQGDGFTQRNLGDLVALEWRRCDATWSAHRLVDPSELRDTFVVEDCKAGNVFARPDLIVRAETASWSWRGQVGDEPSCATAFQGDGTSNAASAVSSQVLKGQVPHDMCISTINKGAGKPLEPKAYGPVATVGQEVPEVGRILSAISVDLRGISEAVGKFTEKIQRDVPDNIRIDAKSIVLNMTDVTTGLAIYPGKQQAEQPTPLYLIYQDRGEEARQATFLGSVRFNFNCSGDSKEHCGSVSACSPEEKATDHAHDRGLGDIAAEAMRALQSRPRKLVIVGWTDPSGGGTYNDRLGKERAEYVMKRLEKLGLPASSMHTIGVGAGDPPAPPALGCDVSRRRADVYFIDSVPSTIIASP